MKRIFGLVGYACNGKSTIIKKIEGNKEYSFVDLPQIYKNEAAKYGYPGVTEWYTAVGLRKYLKLSRRAVLRYINNELPKNNNLIIDDIFDIKVYNRLIKIFPQMELIAFHSKHSDRLKRLEKRTGFTNKADLIKGLEARDNMKKYCGIEDVFPVCKYEINNKNDIESAKKLFNNEINRNLIICIVGYSGSGKSTICKLVGETLNIPVFKYGAEVTKIINNAGYKKSREYVNENGIESYEKLIESNIIPSLKKFMKDNKFFIIDGIVGDEIYNKLNKKNELYSIYIKLDKIKRINRLIKREKLDRNNAIDELEIKDGIKINCGLDIIISKANVIVNGDKPQRKVVSEVLKIIEKININR